MSKSVLTVARAFIAAINAEDVGALVGLMTEDHRFIDALGHRFAGAETMLAGRRQFFHAEWRVFCDTGWTLAPS